MGPRREARGAVACVLLVPLMTGTKTQRPAPICLNGTLGSSPASGFALCCDRRCTKCGATGCSHGTLDGHPAQLLCCETPILRRRRRELNKAVRESRAQGVLLGWPAHQRAEACRSGYDTACILINQTFNGTHILALTDEAKQQRKAGAKHEWRQRKDKREQKQADARLRDSLGVHKLAQPAEATRTRTTRPLQTAPGAATANISSSAPDMRLSWMPSFAWASPEAAMSKAIERMAGFMVGSQDSWRARVAQVLMNLKRDIASAELARGCHPDPLSVAAHSECPSGLWHSQIAPLLAAPEMVMLNAGANKGYNLVEFAQRYSAMARNLTHKWWHTQLRRAGCQMQCCGVCGSCTAGEIAPQTDSKLTMHAFELQRATAEMLRKLVAWSQLPIEVHSTAVSNHSGTVYTRPDVKAGFEAFGIVRSLQPLKHVPRPVTTIDRFMAERRIERAHFVSIDTEGEDSLVLRGMARSLAEKRVDVLEFEYSRKWKLVLGSTKPLSPVIEWLRELGYLCFWQGNAGHLAQVSAPCFREDNYHRFGFTRSNVVCSHRPDILRVFRACQREPMERERGIFEPL